jgi:hypothetical protein
LFPTCHPQELFIMLSSVPKAAAFSLTIFVF